ncbi:MULTISPECIES: D-glycero-beta-D-manno-heptose 1,7-bisphosphate 7-phosphatase [unclassified Pseudoalteromonas]|uniref:D-glycero-beta-D-manno-heptose 1,7-bisphosphate 7-phosphatase n=1 Tax=unclassified Pseudoalteromonas TaxID=194690 RepID=UPI001F3982EE|nr:MULTISPECIES: D-glycero-beta-D-manno-heptose 1,7-bisphosphate 7-phosphatase [unclassified Pseudoalteromonas]MCF2901685.1 D-glycero-beta-D-manno-heptose 1,7-bisphosphate 7-phosphatase [Pseudoalteromonas sp. OFAV1]
MSKVLFLDRDGVVNADHGYVYKPDEFEFLPGVFDACKKFIDAGYEIVIVTNQSGIGRGYYSEQDFLNLTDWMKAEFMRHDVPILDVYFCPHHPTKAEPAYLQDCHCRKPAPGMLLQAIEEHSITPSQSIMVGDKLGDLIAAERVQIATRVLVRSGQSYAESTEQHADYVCESLADLPALILQS